MALDGVIPPENADFFDPPLVVRPPFLRPEVPGC